MTNLTPGGGAELADATDEAIGATWEGANSGPGFMRRSSNAPRRADLRNWVKVEFWAAPPIGLTVTDLDAVEVGRKLAEAFGFEYIDGLTVSRDTAHEGQGQP
jgi:hypothetical protein